MIEFTHYIEIPITITASDDPADKSVGYSGSTVIEDVSFNANSIHDELYAGIALRQYIDSIEDELMEAAREHMQDMDEQAKEQYAEYCADMRRDEDRLIQESEKCSLNIQTQSTTTE